MISGKHIFQTDPIWLFTYLLTGLLTDLLKEKDFTAYAAAYRNCLGKMTILLPNSEGSTAANLRRSQQ